jgi:Cu-Zn family superoxide dismutase
LFNQGFSTGAIILILLSLSFISCTQKEEKEETKIEESSDMTNAVCVLHPTEGSNVRGIIKFEKTNEGIKIIANVTGLTPGNHGFHIHEFGDCSRLDGKSAGGHFNPDGKKHGSPNSEERHVGDLGNLVAGEDGKAHYEWTDSYISFTGSNSIIGRAIIVHAGEDDLTSQPTGNAGTRLACGVIGLAK